MSLAPQFKVNVEVETQRLPSYDYTWDKTAQITSYYVASQAGKKFRICISKNTVDGPSVFVHCFVNGAGSCRIAIPAEWNTPIFVEGVKTGSDVKEFEFPLPSVTTDTRSILGDGGIIKVSLYRISPPMTYAAVGNPMSKLLHGGGVLGINGSPAEGSHIIPNDEAQDTMSRTVLGYKLLDEKKPWQSFIIKYLTLDDLRMKGIIPAGAGAVPAELDIAINQNVWSVARAEEYDRILWDLEEKFARQRYERRERNERAKIEREEKYELEKHEREERREKEKEEREEDYAREVEAREKAIIMRKRKREEGGGVKIEQDYQITNDDLYS